MLPAAEQAKVSFWDRYRALFNKRGNDWWSIVFGYPVARLLVLPLVGLRWVTPNALTLASLACKCAAAAVLLSDVHVLWAVVLLQANTIFDSMDGTLARARRSFSRVGALLDKIGDGAGLFVLMAAVGWRAAQDSGDSIWIVVGCTGAAAYLCLCYMHWVSVALRETPAPKATAGLVETPSWREIGREWLAGWIRIGRFAEADFYFWIALFAAFEEFRGAAVLIASTQLLGLCVRLVTHTRLLAAADRDDA